MARATPAMRRRIGAAVGRSSALPDGKVIASFSVTTRSESRTVTCTASWPPSAATSSRSVRPTATRRSRGSTAAGGTASRADGTSRAGAATAGAGRGGAPARTTDTITNAKSWRTRSLNVISHPDWSSSGGVASAASARRRSGGTVGELDDATSLGGRGTDVPAEHALDPRRVLQAVYEKDAVDHHLRAERLAGEVRVEPGGERQHDDVCAHGAVERREHGDAEAGPDRGEARVAEMPEQEHEADERADQAEGREEPAERHEDVARRLAVRGPLPRLGDED